MTYQHEMKGIKLLQERSDSIEKSHDQINSELDTLKRQLASVTDIKEIQGIDEYTELKDQKINEMSKSSHLIHTSLKDVYAEANNNFSGPIELTDILRMDDFSEAEKRIGQYVKDFNVKYGLDGWDYAIACSCGLFATMLDMLSIKAPLKPTVSWQKKADGVFNKWVQQSFHKIMPPEFSKKLSERFPIGAPDSSTTSQLIDAPSKALSPLNHRLRSLAHDPVIGFIFGLWDMMHGTCTAVVNGQIICIQSNQGPTKDNIFNLLGRMFGHLLSDMNAPSVKNNRGMGLPAPFMDLLKMLEGIPVGDSNFGRDIEWMYLKGYDFRQFLVSCIPMTIMEILLRVFYVGKQVKLYNASFKEAMLDTMPLNLNPRFRIILALAYGTSSAVNSGKMYITGNILNANYASWMGFAWNGFHALKWALFCKHLTLWDYVEEKELAELNRIVQDIETLQFKAELLPV